MEIIILTKDIIDGLKLKKVLSGLNDEFVFVDNFTKSDIIQSGERFKNTAYIFSTWYMPEFSEDEVRFFFPGLKAIFYSAGTVKYFAEPFLKVGVKVFTSNEANAIPVAEFVTSQIVLANKGYFQAQKSYKYPFWRISFQKSRNYSLQKNGNYNAKIGIIGCGAIGSKVVKLLKQYDLDVSVYDPFLSDERIVEIGVTRSDLKEIFSKSDVISLHLPNIPETKGIINWELLSLMKDTATFINTGRGEQVIEQDLARIMRRKPNACALLDVTTYEPIFPWSELLRLSNVFISPHIAGSLSGEYDRLVEHVLSAFYRVNDGDPSMCGISIDQLSGQA
jgi:phosphoglycerate dehydrogenase-like enzyme